MLHVCRVSQVSWYSADVVRWPSRVALRAPTKLIRSAASSQCCTPLTMCQAVPPASSQCCTPLTMCQAVPLMLMLLMLPSRETYDVGAGCRPDEELFY
jgi:hypothetical protein